ncbi:hypothetical protein DFH08DRAFT_676026 [Mycena albidolilacea]|uniref:Uncharacterized protein n=1 Tax=Mycena albidolilacea TaxID=1033008 RepID=A0AAD7AVW7_9AGAR|nr:hypothetical protein DFH08DRAFT_676026 [Mycena albidolilacea]
MPSADREGTTALTRHSLSNHSSVSVMSTTHATAVDVCATMYGENAASSDTIDRFYESSASAGKFCTTFSLVLHLVPESNRSFSYENPVLTATSRSVITDIHQLSRQLSVIDVPRPIALVCTLFRLQPPRAGFLARNIDDPLFQALRVWTEIGDICENESFDGHKKTLVEHTLNILVLPGIHRDGNHRAHPSSDSLITASPASASNGVQSHPSAPGLPIPGTSLTVPSPFHFKLHIITRLSFNEQGRITHHRDFWDVKDVMGLVPGASLAQWIGTRIAAKSLTYVSSFWRTPSPSRTNSAERAAHAQDAMEKGMSLSPAAQFTPHALEILEMS